jgi:hypothetical protein
MKIRPARQDRDESLTVRITDVSVARAVIAHEAVECFVGKEQQPSKEPKKLVSCTGGTFWGKLGEHWPRSASGKPLIPWLQIACTEMDGLYGAFHARRAMCFFIDREFAEFEATSEYDGSDFVVREYGLDEQLAPLRRPTGLAGQKFHRLKWQKVADYPPLSKYYRLFDEKIYSDLCDDNKLGYCNRSGIKIGGWPTPVQVDRGYPGTFDLQIDITKNFMYADAGIGYLSATHDGKWHVMFDCC